MRDTAVRGTATVRDTAVGDSAVGDSMGVRHHGETQRGGKRLCDKKLSERQRSDSQSIKRQSSENQHLVRPTVRDIVASERASCEPPFGTFLSSASASPEDSTVAKTKFVAMSCVCQAQGCILGGGSLSRTQWQSVVQSGNQSHTGSDVYHGQSSTRAY